MHWDLEVDAEQRRVYVCETRRGPFRLVLIRGSSGFAWRVHKQNPDGLRPRIGSRLIRQPNAGWEDVEELAFAEAEDVVVHPLERLAAAAMSV